MLFQELFENHILCRKYWKNQAKIDYIWLFDNLFFCFKALLSTSEQQTSLKFWDAQIYLYLVITENLYKWIFKKKFSRKCDIWIAHSLYELLFNMLIQRLFFWKVSVIRSKMKWINMLIQMIFLKKIVTMITRKAFYPSWTDFICPFCMLKNSYHNNYIWKASSLPKLIIPI